MALMAPMVVVAGLPAPAAAQTVPLRRQCAEPEYPREAIRYELDGIATLRYRIDADGRVRDAEVVESSGWQLLDEAALRTIQACTFSREQAARVKGAPQPVKYVWHLEGDRIRPHLLPHSCRAHGRFAAFRPYDNTPSGADGVKVRLLVDPAGQPRGVKPEGAALPPKAEAALIHFVESCRFGFDPSIKGERTDTVYGRVVLSR